MADSKTPDVIDLIHELHTAVFGDSWARPQSPKWVWEMLLDRVRSMRAEQDELQRRLDARARDLGRFTQSTVDGTKALEQEIHRLRAELAAIRGGSDG